MKNALALSHILMPIIYTFLYLTAIMPASTQLKGLNPAEALSESTGSQTMPLHSRRGLQVSKTETKNQPSCPRAQEAYISQNIHQLLQNRLNPTPRYRVI